MTTTMLMVMMMMMISKLFFLFLLKSRNVKLTVNSIVEIPFTIYYIIVRMTFNATIVYLADWAPKLVCSIYFDWMKP